MIPRRGRFYTTFRADLSGILSRASIDLSERALRLPSSSPKNVAASIDGQGLVGLFTYTAVEFSNYTMSFSDATTYLDEEQGSASVFVNMNVSGLEKEENGAAQMKGGGRFGEE